MNINFRFHLYYRMKPTVDGVRVKGDWVFVGSFTDNERALNLARLLEEPFLGNLECVSLEGTKEGTSTNLPR